ncbi:shikimate dehydrogenase [Arenicellales bacterium nBUS_48]
MNDIFNFEKLVSRCAVVGHPIGHSQSPRIHDAFARQFGITLDYEAIDLDPIAFEQGVHHLQAGGLLGLNVTIPFKEAASRLSDEVSERAALAGAVNTLSFSQRGQILGDNTDGIGFMKDLERNLDSSIAGAEILLIGAGGAARGILHPILSRNIGRLVLTNRTLSRAEDLAILAKGAKVQTCAFEDISGSFDLVINATATSLTGGLPDISNQVFHPRSIAYDLAYSDQPTAFMRWAMSAGAASAVDGLGMLVEQAAESFWIWHQKRPDTGVVIDELRSGVR